MTKLYDGLGPSRAVLEYSLQILHQCMTPEGLNEASEIHGKLETMLVQENADVSMMEKIQKSKESIKIMKECASLGEDYSPHLIDMREILLSIGESFAGN